MAEKSIAEIPRDLRLLFQKGSDALSRENTDYAIDLFNQVLTREPGFFDCRKALRTAQSQKSGGASTGFFKRVLSNAGSSLNSPKPRSPCGVIPPKPFPSPSKF